MRLSVIAAGIVYASFIALPATAQLVQERALSAAKGQPVSADYVDAAGRRWRDLSETSGIAWLDVASVCPTDGVTPCYGNVGRVKFTGWIWATNAQVAALFVELTGLPYDLINPYDPDTQYSETNSTWAPVALTLVNPSGGYSDGSVIWAAGWSATTYGDTTYGENFARYPIIIDSIKPTEHDVISASNIQPTLPRATGAGVWLFKPGRSKR